MTQTSPPLVVGIGGSADALGPLSEMVAHLPAGDHLAYVLVLHPSNGSKASPPIRLDAETSLRIVEARGNMPIEAGCLHVVASGCGAVVRNGRLVVSALSSDTAQPRPVDQLFTSLAKNRETHAVGILLSGEETDGSAGLGAVRAAGGLAVVHAPEMGGPAGVQERLAQQAVADLVLPSDAIGEAIERFARMPLPARLAQAIVEPDDSADEVMSAAQFERLQSLLATRHGLDLNHYKPATVKRRLQRRMHLVGFANDLGGYLDHLREDGEERAALVAGMLISVTEFFRDPACFDDLRRLGIDRLVAASEPGSTLRAWVPGCATGEEAYSVAILLLEAISEHQKRLHVQVFATDVDEAALATARSGTYPAAIADHVSEQRLQRFFVRQNGHTYRVTPALRDVVSFASHDLCRDPPFSRLDLVSCRNLLIYLQPQTQGRVLQLFHFALHSQGVLLLGASESVNPARDLFEPINKEHRLFRRVSAKSARLPAPVPGRPRAPRHASGDLAPEAPPDRPMVELARDALVAYRVPPSVVVARDTRILFTHGDLSPYLHFPEGEPCLDLGATLREDLAPRVRTALYKCRRERASLTLMSTLDAESMQVRIVATPAPEVDEEAVILSFESVLHTTDADESTSDGDQDILFEQLQRELDATREDLRNTAEELETSNEELRASHEEAVSMNEELQSSNEELESASEELRSVNEELTLVNRELKEKIELVERGHADLANFFRSTHFAVLFLDMDLRIRRFTPAAGELFRLGEEHMGQRPADVGEAFLQQDLEADAASVLANLSPASKELGTPDGRWYMRRILPYRTDEQHIDGVVINFLDVTETRATSARLLNRERQQAVVARLGLRALEEQNLDVFLAQAVREVQQTLNSDCAKILELQPDDGRLLLKSGVGWRPGLVGHANVGTGLDSQAGYTLKAREPVVVEDLATEKRFSGPPLLHEHGIVSGISTVIQDRDAPYGVLGIHTRSRREFTREDAHFVTAMANVIGGAVSTNRVRQRLALERGVAQCLTEARNLGDALPRILDVFHEELGTTLCELWSPLPDGSRLVCDVILEHGAHPSKLDPNALLGSRTFGRDEGHLGRSWAKTETVWSTDLGDETQFVRGDQAAKLGLRTAFAFPIRVGETCVGVIGFLGPEPVVPNASLKRSLETAGAAIGQFLRRSDAERDIKEADRQKDEFLAMLGHELRNPLAAIRTATELIPLTRGDDVALAKTQAILARQSAHMARLIDGLLDVSRIVRGKIRLDRETLDLGEVLGEVLNDRFPSSDEASVAIETDIDDAPLWVVGDRVRLAQSIDNIIGNAVRFTPASGRIFVQARAEHGQAVVVVRDTGAGIDPALLPVIFEPFRQAAQTIDRATGGLGLGLALVKGVVELHGGSVSAFSDGPGTGAEFVFRVPLDKPPSTDTRGEARPGANRILVVEDNVDAASLLVEMLTLAGHEVSVAHDGATALEVAARFRPDCVLCDIGLPDGMSGYDVAKALREAGGTRDDVFLLAVTGYGRSEDRSRALEAGFDAHLTKPIDLATLNRLLAERFKRA